MNIPDPLIQLPSIIAQTLGVDVDEITDTADFRLDFNATPQDMAKLQETLELAFDITLPDLAEPDPFTYSDLRDIIEDLTL